MSMWLVNTAPTFRLDVGSSSVGSVTVDITRGDGTLLIDDGATTDNNDGTYDYTLAVGSNTLIDALKLEWTIVSTSEVVTTYEEIVGSLPFTIEEARSFQAKADATAALIPLNSTSEYPDSTIALERERIIQQLEQWTGRSYILRYARVVLRGSGHSKLSLRDGECKTTDGYILDRPGRLNDVGVVLSATISGTAITASSVIVEGDSLIRPDNVWTAGTTSNPLNVVVEYVYGLPYLVKGVDRIAMKMLVDQLVPSAFPDRLLSADTEFGTTRFVQPGGPMNNVSRIPEVNEWVRSHDRRVWL